MRYLESYGVHEIEQILHQYYIDISDFTINQDGSVDVRGNVYLQEKKLFKLPLQFNKVSGQFNISHNNLKSLKGCPIEVRESFYCHNNELHTLKYGPKKVGGHFSCDDNYLDTLKNGPETVGGSYQATNNNLYDVSGFPNYYNGDVYFHKNPVYAILSLVGVENMDKFIKWLNEFDAFRPGKKIVRQRLEEAYWMTCKKELLLNAWDIQIYELI